MGDSNPDLLIDSEICSHYTTFSKLYSGRGSNPQYPLRKSGDLANLSTGAFKEESIGIEPNPGLTEHHS